MADQQTQNNDPDWEYLEYALSLEKKWCGFLPRYTDKELLRIFPEAKRVITEKISEWEQQYEELFGTIKKSLTHAKHSSPDKFSYWFWRYWIQLTQGKKLLQAEGHITRLKRQRAIVRGKRIKGWFTEEIIQQAMAVPIESLIGKPLRKSGKTLVGLCPLHNEKYPSFHVYPANNRFWCFGCNQGGNSITFVRLLHGFSFREAIQHLTGK